jgi:XTP/dITP diphosphohydrolase
MNLCFATNNLHKIQEVQAVVGNSFSLLSLRDIGCLEELPEEQTTIEGNSLQKAQYVFEEFNVACFADDSGLEVEALNGEPGVYSAMYAGPQRSHSDNIDKLLTALTGIENRKAHFKTVITLIQDNERHQFIGLLSGTIMTERRGANGFGYDPIFVPDGYSASLAEMTLTEKNKISHRAKATIQLINFLVNRQDSKFKVQD